jgi:pyruvate formate lyase activating enzyme
MMFYKDKCTDCGICKSICENPDSCTLCGKCALYCPNDARRICGNDITVEEVFNEIAKDISYYENSGGGVTFSGGECMLQINFLTELLKECKKNGINTAVDTAGNVPYSYFEAILPYTDIFLYDIKAYDEDVHIKCTGQSNKIILENLRYIDSCGKKTEIRIPYVPVYNDNQILRTKRVRFKNGKQ